MTKLSSWLVGTLGLWAALIAAILLSRARALRALDAPERRALVLAAGIAWTTQCAHFVEEYLTGFPGSFPVLFGLTPWGRAAFALFNIIWLAVWAAALWAAPRGHRMAEWPLWFLGIALAMNGVAHPLLAVRVGGYFPGLVTAIPAAIAGVMLLRSLGALTRRRASVST